MQEGEFGVVGSVTPGHALAAQLELTDHFFIGNTLCYALGALTDDIAVPFEGGADAAPTARQMIKGAEAITYGLYRNGARDQPWGDPEVLERIRHSRLTLVVNAKPPASADGS